MATGRTRADERDIRHTRVRRKVVGSISRPRLNVFKSQKHFFVQVIDDLAGMTLVSVSTLEADVKNKVKAHANVAAAKAVGSLIAERTLAKGIKKVIFDRGGHRYQGAVKALADAARESGLEF